MFKVTDMGRGIGLEDFEEEIYVGVVGYYVFNFFRSDT